MVDARDARLRAARKAGHGGRVVAHGCRAWKLLMLNCRHLVSSHIDVPVAPAAAARPSCSTGQPAWTFTFLQHGVIKDDLSGWLNPKPIDLFVTSTSGEYDSIAGDGTPYAFTTKEVRLTGLPRFDRLRRIAAALRAAGPRPRPRRPDLAALAAGPAAAGHAAPRGPATTSPTPSTRGLARRAALDRARDARAASTGCGSGFLPHPNLQSVLPTLDLPAHVEPLSFDGARRPAALRERGRPRHRLLVDGLQRRIRRPPGRLLPVRRREGAVRRRTVGRAGYFDYERDGFGPVAYDLADAETAIGDALAAGRRTAEPYRTRIAEAFPDRDGRCCERTVAAIRALG